ncbi:FecR domain-containing protein [Undibacterium sp. Di27W]|uniref:FecR domain-containing protein n=1 Tax=Undibacterium sp. Di27W TaxID=3413036 RepID=UPI003BF3CAE2
MEIAQSHTLQTLDNEPAHIMLGGKPLDAGIADEAAEWLTQHMSGEMTDTDRQRWQAWREAHTEHERAWKHIEAVMGRFGKLQAGAAYQSLSPYATETMGSDSHASRRKALKILLWCGSAGVAGMLTRQTETWQQLAADYHTGVGEKREIALNDGTRITLNTASSIDVHFDGKRRLVRLLAGEIMIVTGHIDTHTRPFMVETSDGSIRALGTHFTVRQYTTHTDVVVLEDTVEISPAAASGPKQLIKAGQGLYFTRHATGRLRSADEQAAAWVRGQIIADDMRLADFLIELSRYRKGVLRCDPAVADLRFSAVFPLKDVEGILSMLPNSLPVKVVPFTRFWVTITPA